MIFQDHTEFLFTIGIKISLIVGISLFVLTVQRILQVFIGRYLVKNARISLDMVNSLKLLVRIGTLVIIFYSSLVIFEYSIESIFGFSTVIGALVSFGSVQWVSNFIAGVYLLFLRPFSINDFLQVGADIRGTVEELSLNYTKIRTINGIYYHIPNRVVVKSNLKLFYGKKKRIIGAEGLDRQSKDLVIHRFRDLARYLLEERTIRYTFLWGAPIGDIQVSKRNILEVCEIYAGVFGYTPEYYLESLGNRMFFRFIIETLNTHLLIENIHDFRNDIISKFH
ncbi:MAG: mechanosensitive ion channel domain-containing protein [Candidatus Thorarchaeota archaeon]